MLSRLAQYETKQGREVLIELEAQVRARPKAEAEERLIAFLGTRATAAGKAAACRHLSVIGSEAAAPALGALLASEDTVEMARYALERIPGERVSAVLRNAIGKAPAKARVGLINTLGVRRDAKAVPLLAKMEGDAAAIAALGRIGTTEAIAALRREKSPAAMNALLTAAERQPPGAAFALYRELTMPAAPLTTRVGALHGLAASDPDRAIAPLTEAMKDKETQGAAIAALGRIDRGAALAALESGWKGLPPAGRAQAIAAISRRRDGRESRAIREGLGDAALEVRLSALEAVSWWGEPTVVMRLARVAASAEEAEKAAARAALERMPGPAVDNAIVKGIDENEGPARLELIRAAGVRGAPGAGEVLLRIAGGSDRALRREAIRALRECAEAKQIAPVLELLKAAQGEAERRELERVVSAALRRSPAASVSIVVLAYRAAEEPARRASLLAILGQSGQAEALPLVEEALADPSPEIVRAAILGLTEWPDASPAAKLLAFAGRTQSGAQQILALRAVLRLMELPNSRPAAESEGLLAGAMRLAKQPEEKKAILSLLPRYATPGALTLAEEASADEAVAQEAKIAVERVRRALLQ